MRRPELPNRRKFLSNSAVALAALGAGATINSRLFADRTQLAARIEEAPSSHPLIPALKLASESLAALDGVKDYKATFIKREMIGRRVLNSRMELKLRESPFSVYLKFIQPHAGREVIFVDGQNDNHMLVHETGFASLVGTLSLEIDGSYALEENRYPVTMIGLRQMVVQLMEGWLAETEMDGITVNYYPNAQIGQQACKAIEATHQRQRPGVKFQMFRLYVDGEHKWPVRLQGYEFPGPRDSSPVLAEDYLYTDLAMNVGLTDVDFSTKNPKYNY